jgi:shikimate 5-dehydrogenase
MKYRRFGLIGHPIAHSLSPALFRAGYDGRYPYELIQTDDFEEAYSRFIKGYDGINVTAPFKEKACAKADFLSDECKVIGAANILVNTEDGIKAYNSDYLGIRLWLQELLHNPSWGVQDREKRATPLAAGGGTHEVGGVLFESCTPQDGRDEKEEYPKVLIVGLGGAGKAAATAAAYLGLDRILMNRDISKAEAVAESVKGTAGTVSVIPIEEFRASFRNAGIVIYNIPTAIDSLHELDDDDFTPGQRKVIMEANYKDSSFGKELLAKMHAANPLARYTGGKTWLLYQAVTGYEIFTGEKPDLAEMRDVL